ncbi:hypothetical protein ACFT2C_04695 [Promicromonospora sp. NPDC057138]|uniref:hypothetical protein n=1 Tax=Promicromonospora sp. NPDC057138 TaxID=3346031 RepID=UPI00362F2C69
MPSTSPQHDAEDTAEALRRLAHSTQKFDDPADTYWVISDLAATVRRLEQVVSQVAAAHRENLHLAHDDQGAAAGGHVQALTAAEDLRKAGELFGRAYVSLDLAMGHSGAIAWYPASTTPAAAARSAGRRPRAQARHARHDTSAETSRDGRAVGQTGGRAS